MTLALAACLLRISQGDEVPANRVQKLSSGITETLELVDRKGSLRGRYDTTLTAEDDHGLAAAGFQNIRLVIDPSELLSADGSLSFDQNRVDLMLRQIKTAEDAGLAVVVAPTISRSLLAQSAAFFGKFAAALSATDPDLTFLELGSEPPGSSGDAWQLISESWVSSARQNMPRHTFVVHAGGSDAVKDLLGATLVSDNNVVYAFRFFEPKQFTTQLLPGSRIKEEDKVSLPYPATAATIVPILSGFDDQTKDWAMEYAKQRWSSDLMLEMVRPIEDWSTNHKARVICEAFGASQKAPAEDRARYLKDVRTALESIRVGWCVSQYVGPYGLYSGSPGNRHADAGVLSALGKSG